MPGVYELHYDTYDTIYYVLLYCCFRAVQDRADSFHPAHVFTDLVLGNAWGCRAGAAAHWVSLPRQSVIQGIYRTCHSNIIIM